MSTTMIRGNPDQERRSRISVVAALGVMIVIWIALSGASFAGSRHRADPDTFTFNGQGAVAGKRVFQAFSCMDCHTLVGNGAYFAPDLTFIYSDAGPAWLEAFLASPGTWPTKAVVDMHIDLERQNGDLGVASADEYYAKYPGALRRLTERGGRATLMPNLPFRSDEIPSLVAFFKYTSQLNTQGWPPKPMLAEPANASPATASPAAGNDAPSRGRSKAAEMGCVACHSTDGTRLVGPTWKGLYGSLVPLSSGGSVRADDGYIIESILEPGAKVVDGYPASVMPPYRGRLSDGDVKDLLAYLQSLE